MSACCFRALPARARRPSGRPVVAAGQVPGYGAIFNAGVLHHDGVFHLFARGVRDGYRRNDGPGPRFLDYLSDVLVFTSVDGLRYEFQQVLARSAPDGVHCYEDPRVQLVRSGGEERIVMTYTNLPAPDSGLPWRVGVHRLGYEDGRFFLNHTSGRVVSPEGIPDKDAVVCNLRDGRVALIHRIHPDMQIALFDSLDALWEPDASYWDEHLRSLDEHVIISPSPGALGVGAGAPPVETPDGLLLFFHEREATGEYTAKVALLDDLTGRVKAMLPEPILRPQLPWERTGDVDNVIFVQGAVARPDGTVYLTYGAADRCIGVASVVTTDLLRALRSARCAPERLAA
ncbi:MAG TPA: hypothetical protein VFT19_11515 [Solirubrobacterales bacterium]|nr:hypothetical protein [Solirubrobacterales bacterium]